MPDLHAGFQRPDADARAYGLFDFLERVDGLPHVQAIKRRMTDLLAPRAGRPASPSRAARDDGGSAMLIKLAHFLEIMLYVLVAGVMWGTWLALGRTMTQYGAGTFLTDGKHMIANLGVVMAVLIIAAVVAGLVAAFWLFRARSTTAAWLALAGLLLMVAVLVVTLAVEVPIDNKISSWSVATLPPDWRDIRAQWAGFHTLRTFLSLGAVAAAVGAALTAQVMPSRATGPRKPASSASRG